MKRKLLFPIVLCVFAGLTVFNVGLAHRSEDTDTTLDLISVMAKALEEGEIGLLRCICVPCPDHEDGCWSYDYMYNDNIGYIGSRVCTPYTLSGWIEQHVIDVDPNACQSTF
jgi:hypothetical protein